MYHEQYKNQEKHNGSLTCPRAIYGTLKMTMDVVERGVISMRKTNKHWDIPLSSLSNHLNGKTQCRKVGLLGVPTKEEDVIVVAWIANMQKHGLSISLQQLKFKVEKFIQGQPTPLKWSN